MCPRPLPHLVEECYRYNHTAGMVHSLIGQHGVIEKEVDRMYACAIRITERWQQYWPFLQCMEHNSEAWVSGMTSKTHYQALGIGAALAHNSRPVLQSKSAMPYFAASSGSNQPDVLQGIMMVDAAML